MEPAASSLLGPSPPLRKLGDTKFSYRSLNPANQEIRLLQLQPGDYSQPILCWITHASLNRERSFTAISYAWGDPEDTCLIYLDQLEFPITRSLMGALRALRSRSRVVMVWADGICINQSDNVERGLQVLMMTKIYSACTETALWLGPEEDDSELGLALLDDLASSALDAQNVIIASNHRRHLLGLVNIFERSYWSRLWCVQEVFNSKNIMIYCGHHKASWHTYCRIQESFQALNACLREYFPGVARSYVPLSHLLQEGGPQKMESYDSGSHTSILLALSNQQNKSCMDPRDRVYAILGLLDENARYGFVVNYNISVRKLYTDVVVNDITKTRKLDSICACTPDLRNQFSLPSWVPDWTNGELRSSLVMKFPSFSAAGRSEAVLSLDTHRSKLQVSALHLDTIRAVFIRIPEGSHILHVLVILTMWRADISRYFGYKSSAHESFARTLSLGDLKTLTPLEWLNQLYYIIDNLFKNRRLTLSTDSQLDAFNRVPAPQTDMEMMQIVDGHEAEELPGRQFSITTNSSQCISVGAIREADEIYILSGCSTPVVLRHLRGSEYTFIGEIYVDGYMYGKAMEEEQERTNRLWGKRKTIYLV